VSSRSDIHVFKLRLTWFADYLYRNNGESGHSDHILNVTLLNVAVDNRTVPDTILILQEKSRSVRALEQGALPCTLSSHNPADTFRGS